MRWRIKIIPMPKVSGNGKSIPVCLSLTACKLEYIFIHSSGRGVRDWERSCSECSNCCQKSNSSSSTVHWNPIIPQSYSIQDLLNEEDSSICQISKDISIGSSTSAAGERLPMKSVCLSVKQTRLKNKWLQTPGHSRGRVSSCFTLWLCIQHIRPLPLNLASPTSSSSSCSLTVPYEFICNARRRQLARASFGLIILSMICILRPRRSWWRND